MNATWEGAGSCAVEEVGDVDKTNREWNRAIPPPPHNSLLRLETTESIPIPTLSPLPLLLHLIPPSLPPLSSPNSRLPLHYRALPMDCERISAVILDLDGTLVDTERATEGILKEFLARYGKVLDAAKEEKRLGKMHKESAAAIVEDYGLPMSAEEYSEAIMPLYQERWPQARTLPGSNRLIRHLHKHGIPLALASNSIRKHIEIKISFHQGWKESFSFILGGDDVSHGKPSPDIYLEAAKRLGVETSNCLVIEDSLVGMRAAKAAGAKVVAVPSLQGQDEKYSVANCLLRSLLDFQPESWGLPAFEDWVQGSLPIEPLFVKSLGGELVCHDGLTQVKITADTGSYEYLPDQLRGVFFGWAKVEMRGIYKVIVCTGWDTSSGVAKRVILPCLLEEIDSRREEQLHLFLVGYVRKLQNEGNMWKAFKVYKEDVDIARAGLDLPVFSHHCYAPLVADTDTE
ncbi:bifunctional riboflavin kinase/FMN phosphatase-like [Canna indica]|uniref:Bifunctional riboflavin kinase/FMN phosphatase-like n=1 Tax=Canna indica TaxID=4628 RepID=A0AAQ3KYH7_9LILI|nr:bifunctional riboflavin kinase/FMN phosphatase-like [Canna indica]